MWFIFLTWIFLAIYYSSEDDWWTVMKVEQTSYDTFEGSVSFIKVFIGALISIVIGFILYKIVRKK